jgi:hypothetical protein
VLVVFIANLGRPALSEAEALAPLLAMTPYETRLALAVAQPTIVLTTTDRNRANDVLGVLRSRGHVAHLFDNENFVASEAMTKADDFTLDADGMRRTANGELLPYGDIYAILRAVHDTTRQVERPAQPPVGEDLVIRTSSLQVFSKTAYREPVVYFFRRSGEKPWLLRERHASYVGLGDERTPIAFANSTRTIARVRASAAMAIYDDRLARRRVAERIIDIGERSSRNGMDLLAHLLAMTIASQGGSPYR